MMLIDSPRISAFDSARISFGRHETFPLRYSWLTKGFRAAKKDPEIFNSEDATVELGVGRNMVNSIRYWLRATRMAELTPTGIHATALGEAIFGEEGWDPYLEDEGTIWLLHWLLSTNPEHATAWYWFFNHYHKPEFTSQELSSALLDFAKQNISAKCSVSTVKQDAAIVLRMYVQSRGQTRTPLEEALDSPLSTLNLVTYFGGNRRYQSKPERREGLPTAVFGYVVTEVCDFLGASEIPIEHLMYGERGLAAPGAIFRLTEAGLLTKLERLIQHAPGLYELRETAGIHQLYKLAEVDALDFLRDYYVSASQGVAA